MSRFFVEPKQIFGAEIEITDRNDIKHISKVLRLKEGNCVDISDGLAYEYSAEIVEISMERILLKILDKQNFGKEPVLKVTLYQGIPKQGKMESIIQKTVELGIYRIVPVFTKRCVVTESGNKKSKWERFQKIADEAVKQCKRGKIPQVEEPLAFSQMLTQACEESELVLFLYENEEQSTIKQILRGEKQSAHERKEKISSVALLVGPEGGFSEEEAAQIKRSKAKCVTLGKTILRTETAGMAALAMVMYELELEG